MKTLITLMHLFLLFYPHLALSKISDPSPKATIVNYGYYEFTEETIRYKMDSSPSGYAQCSGKPKLVEQTNKIPIKKGRLMAFYYQLTNLPSDDLLNLTVATKHPEIIKPDGIVSTSFKKTKKIKVRGKEKVFIFDGYSFDHDYEMVEGKWVFEVIYKGTVLLTQEFETFKP